MPDTPGCWVASSPGSPMGSEGLSHSRYEFDNLYGADPRIPKDPREPCDLAPAQYTENGSNPKIVD